VAAEVAYRLEGPEDAPTVVLSNSLGTTRDMWDRVAEALARHFRVLRYDTRGHGESPVPDGPYSVVDLGGDVLALLDRLGLERASFCGLSIGAITGLWLGANAGERVDRLVVCSTAAHLPPREQWIERAAQVRSQGLEPQADAAIERWFTPEFLTRDPETVRRIRESFIRTPAEGYAACCEALADFDMRGDLGAIGVPTLVIGGAEDPVAPPDRLRELEAGIPAARLTVISAARHLVAVERPEEVTNAVQEHLGSEVPR
jgi:3-oxoadipate enol-lactonase